MSRKKIIFATLYRSPSQDSEQFESFIANLQLFFSDLRNENPHCIILTGDFNCRSSQWWPDDEDTPQGTALDELMETNNVYQLILLLINYWQLPITSTVLLKKIQARKLGQYFSTCQRLSIGFGMKV